MSNFAIIELEDGLMVVPIRANEQAEEVATREGGTLVVDSLYSTYEEACDALAEMEGLEEEDERY
ncbi:MAG: hypothetical protein KDB14_10710 [Planctomycetales bacterium]|nr:hypothetical protein [Planctomycetales bacterium]